MADTVTRIVLSGVDNTGPATRTAKQNMASLAEQTTVSAKQAAAAMRLVPAQLTDIVTQLAGGQSPFLVLIQQGGQLKDMFGGVQNAAKAMGNYLLSLATPVNLAAAGVAAMGAAAYQGNKEISDLNKAIVTTGGYAGVSASQMLVMAASISTNVGTQREAIETLTLMASSGKLAGSQFEQLATSAQRFSAATGQSVSDLVAEFVRLGDEPAKASATLNEKYHYLTLSVYEQIKALEEQGRKEDAAALAQKARSEAMDQQTATLLRNLTWIEKGWNAVAAAAKGALSAMISAATGPSLQQQIDLLEKSLSSAQTQYIPAGQESGRAAAIESYRAQIAKLRGEIDKQNANAKRAGIDGPTQQAGIAASENVGAWQDRAKGVSAVTRELEKYHQQLEIIRKADPNSDKLSAANVAAGEAAIRKANQGSAGPKKNEYAINTDLADLQGDMQKVERGVKASIEAIKTDYDVGLIGTRAYIDKDFAIRQDGLQKQLVIAKQLEEVASGKKNTAAAQRYQNEIEKIQDEITAGTAKHADDITRYDFNAKRATNEYLASLNAEFNVRQQAISDIIAGASLGAIGQEQLQRMTNLTREFNKRKEDLRKAAEKPEAPGGISRETYDKELADLQSYYDRRVAQEKDFNAKDRANRSDPNVGAAKAFNDYKEQAADVAGQTQRQWAGLYSNLEDAAVGWATRSKVSIASVGQAFYAELVRMQIRAAASSVYSAISGGLGLAGLFGGGSSIAAAGASDTSSIYSLVSGASGLGLKFKANAKGDIYSTGGLHEYVNSIVSRPTIFPFAKGGALGLMGEAGSEAIMPLSRGPDGSLGVKTVAGSSSQQPFVYAPVAHFAVDARADRAAVISDLQQLFAQNNKAQLENLKRLGVIPA